MTDVAHLNDGVITVTIAVGASLSEPFSLDGRHLAGIITPTGWTAAVLTFKAGPDANRLFSVYDEATERSIASATIGASRFLALDPLDWLGMGLIQLRSGTTASPVNQATADRIFRIVTTDPAPLR